MAGITLLYQQCLEYALSVRQTGQAIIALGHCHMVGGAISEESERRIVIGGTEALSAAMFDSNVAYAALGHLHLAQKVGKQEHLRYCGSPLPMSFAEIDYPHQVLRVDLKGEQVAEIHPLLVPRSVQLLRIPAKPAPLAEVLSALSQLSPAVSPALSLDLNPSIPPELNPDASLPIEPYPYLEVRVRLDAPEPGLRAAIEAALEGKAVRLAKIETSFMQKKSADDGSDSAFTADSLAQIERLQPDDIFARLYQNRYQSDAPPEMKAAFTEIMLANPESGGQA